MIRLLFLSLVLFAISLPVQKASAEGYELKVRIKNLANKDIIMGHHFANNLYPDDTTKLDSKGFGIFKGKTKFHEVMYFIMTPSHTMVDIFLTDNQNFSMETDTLNLLENLKFENSPENSSALEYTRFMIKKQKETTDFQEKKKKTTNENEIKQIDTQLGQITKEYKEQTSKLIAEQKENFVGKFIKATQEIDVPEPPKDASGKITDSLFQYHYYRSHYFDNFNIADAGLLRTPIYEDKIKKYIEKVIPQIPDTIDNECDKILTIAEKDKEVFRYMLITLFNYYASSQIMGFDAVYVHIAEKWYIPKATFSDTTFIRETRENITKLKPLLLGKVAPNVRMLWVPTEHFIQAKTDTIAQNNPHIGSFIDLNSINTKYTILAFWECECSHCKKEIPELYEVYNKLKPKGVEVFAVHMLGGVEGKKKWISFVNEHKLYNWINVWNPYNYDYKKQYDIRSTPAIFILDKDKKIIGKKLDPKQIEDFLNTLISREEKNKK
jgi:thiol-disulfide isomerase/thioredoxin